jgi:hypothetical protein
MRKWITIRFAPVHRIQYSAGRRTGLVWRGASRHRPRPISQRRMTSLHYGNDGGFCSGLFQRRCTPLQRLQQLRDPSSCWAIASTNGATLFEIRLQCFKSPTASDWSYAWTTSFTAAVRDGSPPAASRLEGPSKWSLRAWSADLDATATDAGGGARQSVYR